MYYRKHFYLSFQHKCILERGISYGSEMWGVLYNQHMLSCSIINRLSNIFANCYTWMNKAQLHASRQCHDDVIKWKHFPRYWPFVRRIHRSPVNSPHKGQWRGALMFSSICVWINGWVNNREAGDLRRHRAHYDVMVMYLASQFLLLTLSASAEKIMYIGAPFAHTDKHILGYICSHRCY